MRRLLVAAVLLSLVPVPAADASQPLLPLDGATTVEWPEDPTVGAMDRIRVTVHPQRELHGELNITLLLPDHLSTTMDPVWRPEVGEGETAEHSWEVRVVKPGIWRAQVHVVLSGDEDVVDANDRREHSTYGLSSADVPSGTTPLDPHDLVPRDLAADGIEAHTERTLLVRFTPADWMDNGSVRAAHVPRDPWEARSVQRIDPPDGYWTPLPDTDPATLQVLVSDDLGPKQVGVFWQSPDGDIEVLAACWTVNPRADPVGPYPCGSYLRALPAPGGLPVAAALLAVAVALRSRRP